MADKGVNGKSLCMSDKSVQQEVTEGTSALFLYTDEMTVDKVQEQLKCQMGALIRSNLSNEQEEQLRAGFAEE